MRFVAPENGNANSEQQGGNIMARFDKLTLKAQEAVQAAQDLASQGA